ncbi:MAG: TSUP family transporter, partial [Chloroflexi bacterium]|nr:TSUP family transporter [Chloroflexota bacterium]
MELLLLALLGAGASAITIVSGFGLNTVLVPAFAVLFPLPLAIAAVALVHLIASAIRLVIFRAHINRTIALQFVPWAILGGIAGALILELLGAVPVVATYPLFGLTKSITAVKVVVGVTISALAVYELRRETQPVGLGTVGVSAGALA